MTIFTPRPQWIVDLINELAGPGAGGVWGAITGTLSSQTDLQAALNAKVDDSQISAFGATLIDDADAAAARTTLGLGTAATLSTSDIDERARDAVGTALVAGSNITITPNDGADTITIAATGGGTDLFDEEKEYRSAMGIGGSNVPQQNGIALVTTGSTSSVLITGTSFATSRYRSGRTTGISSGASAGFRDPEFKLYRRHGFKVAIRFVVETISGSDMRIFAGLTSEALLTNQDPSSHDHVLGFGLDSADSNFQRMENDSGTGTATKTDTGIALAANEMFEAVIECTAGGDPSLTLYHWGSANTTPTPTATYGPATVTTDIPTTTQQLFPYIWWNNAATAASAICSVVSIRIWA